MGPLGALSRSAVVVKALAVRDTSLAVACSACRVLSVLAASSGSEASAGANRAPGRTWGEGPRASESARASRRRDRAAACPIFQSIDPISSVP